MMKFDSGLCFEKLTAGFLAVMMTVFLLGFGLGGYTDITVTKYILFVVISSLYLLGMAGIKAVTFMKEKHWFVNPGSLWRDAGLIQRIFVLMLVFSAISALVSSYGLHTLIGYHRYEGLLTITLYIVTFLLVSVYGRPKKWLLFLFAAVMTIFCLICFCQLAGYNPYGLYPDGLTYYDAYTAYRYAYLGTIGNVDLVAALLAVAAPVLLLAFLRLKEKSRYFLLIPFCGVLAVTVLSQVAAAYLAVFGGLILLIPIVMVKTKRRKCLAWLLIVLLLFAGIALVFCCDYGNGTFHEIHALLHGKWDDDFGTGRLYIWRNVLALVPEHPLFGGGPDTLGQRMTVDFERYDAKSGVVYRAAIDTAHNEYLNILVNEGVLALATYLTALIVFFILFLKNNKDNDILAICGSGVFCYCIQAFFGMRMCITAPFFWLCWALALSACQKHKMKSAKT